MRFFSLLVSVVGSAAMATDATALEFQADATPDGKPFIMVTGEFLPEDDLSRFDHAARWISLE